MPDLYDDIDRIKERERWQSVVDIMSASMTEMEKERDGWNKLYSIEFDARQKAEKRNTDLTEIARRYQHERDDAMSRLKKAEVELEAAAELRRIDAEGLALKDARAEKAEAAFAGQSRKLQWVLDTVPGVREAFSALKEQGQPIDADLREAAKAHGAAIALKEQGQ